MIEVQRIITPPLGANSFVVDKCVLVDVGGDPLFLIKKLKNLNVSPSDIKYVFLTHLHHDHSAAADFLKRFGCKIVVHKDEYEFAKFASYPLFSSIEPDIFVSGNEVFSVSNLEFKIIHTPGHTPGSICILEVNNGWLFTGDTVFPEGGFGRVDFPGGNLTKLVESLEKLWKIKDYVNAIFPGHEDVVYQNAKENLKKSLDNAKHLLKIYKGKVY